VKIDIQHRCIRLSRSHYNKNDLVLINEILTKARIAFQFSCSLIFLKLMSNKRTMQSEICEGNRVTCGGVNFHVDARGRRIKIERYRIPESCKKKVSMPMWRPQSMDRCLPFERLHQRSSSSIGESIYFIQWRKKRVEGWVDRVALQKRTSLKETLSPTTSVEPRMDTFIE